MIHKPKKNIYRIPSQYPGFSCRSRLRTNKRHRTLCWILFLLFRRSSKVFHLTATIWYPRADAEDVSGLGVGRVPSSLSEEHEKIGASSSAARRRPRFSARHLNADTGLELTHTRPRSLFKHVVHFM